MCAGQIEYVSSSECVSRKGSEWIRLVFTPIASANFISDGKVVMATWGCFICTHDVAGPTNGGSVIQD